MLETYHVVGQLLLNVTGGEKNNWQILLKSIQNLYWSCNVSRSLKVLTEGKAGKMK